MNAQALRRMSQAMDFYEVLGFKPVEVPWVVSPMADDMTKPESASPLWIMKGAQMNHIHRRLPGSGEQGFIQLILEGKLGQGQYQTLTPCWRDEIEDDLHRPYFWKLELIIIGAHCAPLVKDACLEFFQAHAPGSAAVRGSEGTDDLYDIVAPSRKYGSIELGSYGHRFVKTSTAEIPYTYGTGCVEPRLTIAVENP